MGQAASRQQEFWEACSYGREWLVKRMIEEGIDVNWVSHIHDCCPIHVASQGDVGIVRLLIAAGCNVDAEDVKGNTALHHAAMAGKAAVCELLLEAGANVNAVNHNGWTPLLNACYWHHAIVVQILLLHDANVNIKNKEGRKCIHEVCRSKCATADDEVDLVVIFDQLMEAGCNILEKSENVNLWDCEADFSPLMFACYHGHIDLVERLLERDSSNIDDCDMNGWTALHWAGQRSNKDIVSLLLQHGASACCLGRHNESPADCSNDLEVREMLLNPNAHRYPTIVSNGHVTTDEEEEDEDEEDGSHHHDDLQCYAEIVNGCKDMIIHDHTVDTTTDSNHITSVSLSRQPTIKCNEEDL